MRVSLLGRAARRTEPAEQQAEEVTEQLAEEVTEQLAEEVTEQQAERMRTRVRLLVQLTTRHGRYRRGLVQAGAWRVGERWVTGLASVMP